ncbi:Coiled-coil domain-containing protein 43 [Pseudolycoriella hygida]|uniref:Coiled-coil domain-containing protein 43 n=1 Tax=Pseudolycoriella hygida TaxID=35572 RepID=A0A9Q0NCK6_9DIPT|nr:Coiled-coil domain-containing protein 43 [Pseudolycoriella hygida]
MATGENFFTWLNIKLRELKTDENVYGSYISGILDSDESSEEKKEALEEILSQIIEVDIETHLQTILEKWQQCNAKIVEHPRVAEDVNTKLAKLMESNSLPTTVVRQHYTPEELRIREQILAQYSQVELDECQEDDVNNGAGVASDPIMIKNTNASDVAQLAKERREQASFFEFNI